MRVWCAAAHVPWIMPQRFLDMQLPLYETDVAAHPEPPIGYVNVSLFRCCSEFGAMTPPSGPMLDSPLNRSMQQLNRQHYRAAVSWTDFNVGRLVAGLEENEVADSTAILFHGDHGWNLGVSLRPFSSSHRTFLISSIWCLPG